MLTRKGVYPYDYVSSIGVLSETKLPPKEEFYSKLNDEDITDDDYQHALNVWTTFKCQSIRDYHDLSLKSDVLLLADVFENFRKTCLKHYNLDPAHYYTSSGLAWDACLKETGQKLELLHDYDMLMMFERGIRGGITHISKRYAEANNKYMVNQNPSKPSTYIQYLDANNLYGWAMSQPLPTHGFRWINGLTVDSLIRLFERVSANDQKGHVPNKGYIFEVDLVYPPELWKSHNDYPLAPEMVKVNGVEKLIGSFKPRKKYVVHYRNLKMYLEMGMILSAVHRGISFQETPWMKGYIMKNTELRKKAANSFEKDFFQLIHYNYIREKYGSQDSCRAELLFTDTDSLLFLIHTDDFYKDIHHDVETKFDTSDYPPNYKSGIPTGVNKKVIGMFKDEVAGRQITHFVGPRPKLYSVKIEGEGEQRANEKIVKKCKGIKKNVVKKGITFDDYVNCLFSGETKMKSMKIIRSENHDIYSKEVNKIALSSDDDKRVVLEDRVNTLAYRYKH